MAAQMQFQNGLPVRTRMLSVAPQDSPVNTASKQSWGETILNHFGLPTILPCTRSLLQSPAKFTFDVRAGVTVIAGKAVAVLQIQAQDSQGVIAYPVLHPLSREVGYDFVPINHSQLAVQHKQMTGTQIHYFHVASICNRTWKQLVEILSQLLETQTLELGLQDEPEPSMEWMRCGHVGDFLQTCKSEQITACEQLCGTRNGRADLKCSRRCQGAGMIAVYQDYNDCLEQIERLEASVNPSGQFC